MLMIQVLLYFRNSKLHLLPRLSDYKPFDACVSDYGYLQSHGFLGRLS